MRLAAGYDCTSVHNWVYLAFMNACRVAATISARVAFFFARSVVMSFAGSQAKASAPHTMLLMNDLRLYSLMDACLLPQQRRFVVAERVED